MSRRSMALLSRLPPLILALLARPWLEGGEGPGSGGPGPHATDFQGPEACAACHPQHYQEWRGSAHAYAAVDPIVQACNRRALKETAGSLKGFCAGCHNPIGARTGELEPSFDMAGASPLSKTGVSCEVCHRMEPPGEGKPIANASFELSSGTLFFGTLADPEATPAHLMAKSEFLPRSEFCGTCHDVIHNAALLEKSFAQWSASVHKQRAELCQDCHMLRYSGQAAVGGPFRESLRRHDFPAVSLPLIRFPNRGRQQEQIQQFLRTAARLTVLAPEAAPAGGELPLEVRVKNSGAGHNLPTGLANERQMWLEVTARDAAGRLFFESGGLDANGDLMDHHSALRPGADQALVLFTDRFLDGRGEEVPFVWRASSVAERSLKPLEERSSTYRIPVPAALEGSSVRVRVRLLFRSFPPHALRDLGLDELIKELPIWEMESFDTGGLPVLRELPRKVRYRVPGDFATIQEGIQLLRDGDELVVAPGEYELEEPVDFQGKSLALLAPEGPGRTTIRFGGDPGRAGASAVVFKSGEGRGARLEGFTITGGRGTELAGARAGGGIYIARSSPTITGNVILDCRAEGGSGGGIFCDGGEPAISGNEIAACQAELGGGAAFRLAAGSSLLFEGNTIQGNLASRGGGLHFEGGRALRLERSLVAGNSAREGGGIFAAEGTTLRLNHVTFVHNRARAGPAAVRAGGPGAALAANSIFWSNDPPGGASAYSFSLVEEDLPLGAGCLKGLPLFVDPTGSWQKKRGSLLGDAALAAPASAAGKGEHWIGGDYHLLFGSPAIDAGDPSAPADPDGTRTDMGAFYLEQPLKAFVRGDVSGNGAVEPQDLELLFKHLFLKEGIPCQDAADFDDDGRVTLMDAVSLAVSTSSGALAPAPPRGACGLDPTPADGLSCEQKGAPCRGEGG